MIELNRVYNEDCRETMKRMEDNSIDSIVTDPPYELGFMGKSWDNSGIAYNVELWRECLRVLKPGGYLLAFGGTRTSHRMVCAIEDAGFEIRDSILWLYGSGFPKSLNIGKEIDRLQGNEREVIGEKITGADSKNNEGTLRLSKKTHTDLNGKTVFNLTKGNSEYEGWGTALKPAHEPICVARKPIEEKTVAQNVLKYGTGGINIDECRVDSEKGSGVWGSSNKNCKPTFNDSKTVHEFKSKQHDLGRFPANVILDEFTAGELDKQVPEAGAFAKVKKGHNGKSNGIYGDYASKGDDGDTFYDDKGGASRFFYIAKADRGERNDGLHQFKEKPMICSSGTQKPGSFQSENTNRSSQNFHPTVKPIKLIQYLQRLVTPKEGITYDPFGGSGTSALSASNEGFKWILSEISPEYFDIANKRIYNNNGLFI
jgi:DNA modification methylase